MSDPTHLHTASIHVRGIMHTLSNARRRDSIIYLRIFTAWRKNGGSQQRKCFRLCRLKRFYLPSEASSSPCSSAGQGCSYWLLGNRTKPAELAGSILSSPPPAEYAAAVFRSGVGEKSGARNLCIQHHSRLRRTRARNPIKKENESSTVNKK
jgi:hypothetical protein